ncbi:MAG: hypothetical protein WDZ85_03785 [Candidatus Paceibacterota bacterium]
MESFPNPSPEQEKERRKQEYILLVEKLMAENQENFPFPGIDPNSYEIIKAEQEELPGYGTPIDELITRFQAEGLKIVFGKYPESGNVFVLPQGSDDIVNDSLFPRHLDSTGDIDLDLKKLIDLNKK